jgi:hypothetical protein
VARKAPLERHPTKAPLVDSKPALTGLQQARPIPTSARVAQRPAVVRQREAQVAAVVVVVAEVAVVQRPRAVHPTSGRAAGLKAQAPQGAQLPAARAARHPRSGLVAHRPGPKALWRVRRHPMRVTQPEAVPAERETRPASPMSPAGQAWRPTTPADPSSAMPPAGRSRLVQPVPAPA